MSKEYKDYLKSIQIGDTVYPCYDAKCGRATNCVVIEITDEHFVVQGSLYGCYSTDEKLGLDIYPILITKFDRKNGECWTKYENSTLLIKNYIQDELKGDLYKLQDIQTHVDDLDLSYLRKLGIK